MRLALLTFLSVSALCAAEPSAFGAGDLDSPNPYGLTESEKHILKNKEMLADVKKKSNSIESQVDSLRERMDGLQSIVEGLNEKAYNNQLALQELKKTYDYDRNERTQSMQELENVVKVNESNVVELKKVLESFSGMLDKINGDYVTKAEYNALVKEINDFKALVGKELKQKRPAAASSEGGNELDKMSNAEVSDEAEALYEKKYYTKAIEYYEHLILKKYKPARANYMIATMWFKRKDYGKAIAYYKESASLYSKADYMPELMLNTAISMEATNDLANAKKFYGAVVTQYPSSSEAEDAKKRLAKLQ
jgi:TolA-binding protein